jgi:hypothetical protein
MTVMEVTDALALRTGRGSHGVGSRSGGPHGDCKEGGGFIPILGATRAKYGTICHRDRVL